LIRLGILAVVLVAIGVAAYLIASGGDDKSTQQRPSTPVAATPASLAALQSQLNHPVYWAGKRKRFTYELTRTLQGYTYIRYLPPGVQLGINVPDYLTIGTYPKPNAYPTVQAAAKLPGAWSQALPKGGLAATNPVRPKSVYVSYPGLPYLIEVYDPDPARARKLVLTGKIVPVA
jgi:hypothetical protein